jgi:ribosomal protein L25 (general stress protein Ctc)
VTATIAPIVAKLSLNVSEFSAGVARAEADAGRLAKRLEDQVRQFGLSRDDLRIQKLADKGVSEETVAKLKALNATIAEQKASAAEFAAAQGRANAVIAESLTPLEKHIIKLRELNDLRAKGMISGDIHSRAVAAANAKLNEPERMAAEAAATAKAREAQAQLNALKSRAQAITQATLTPLEVHRAKLAELNGLLRQRLISEETYRRAVQQSTASLAQQAGVAAKGPGGVDKFVGFLKGGEGLAKFGVGLVAADMMLRRVNTALDNYASIQERVARGDISAAQGRREFTDSLISSIPVLGQAYDATAKLIEILDGTAAANARAMESSRQLAEQVAKTMERREAVADARSEVERAARARVLNAAAPADRIRFQAEFDYQDAMKKVADFQRQLRRMSPDRPEAKELRGLIGQMTGEADSARSSAYGRANEMQFKAISDAIAPLADRASKAGKSLREVAEIDLRNIRGMREGDIQFGLQLFDQAVKAEEAAAKLQRVKQTLADAAKAVENFGKTPLQMGVGQLFADGASQQQIQQFIAMQTALDALHKKREQHNKDVAEAARLNEAAMSPMERYEKKIGELSRLRDQGLINRDVYAKNVRDARAELEKTAVGEMQTSPRFAAAVTMRFTGGAPGQNQNRELKDLVTLTREQNGHLRKISDAAGSVTIQEVNIGE